MMKFNGSLPLEGKRLADPKTSELLNFRFTLWPGFSAILPGRRMSERMTVTNTKAT